MPKTIEKCQTGCDFVQYVKHNPATKEVRQTGSHVIAKGPRPGIAVIPNHKQDLPVGTRRSIIKMLIAIGLGLLYVLWTLV